MKFGDKSTIYAQGSSDAFAPSPVSAPAPAPPAQVQAQARGPPPVVSEAEKWPLKKILLVANMVFVALIVLSLLISLAK